MNQPPTGASTPPGSGRPNSPIGGWVIGVVFVLVAVWFLFGPNLLDQDAQAVIDRPIEELMTVGATQVTLGPLRETMTEATVKIGGYAKQCSECHSLFKSQDGDTPRRLSQHTDIQLNHGMNDRCFNCHNNEDRNYLVAHNGANIEFAQAEMLCSKCHGPTYRDWQVGTHGRVDGYWDSSRGEQQKLSCTNCHNPHSPAFGQMATFPGPDTLRLKVKSGDGHDGPSETDLRNPLRRWRFQYPETHGKPAGNNPYHDEDEDHDDDYEKEEDH